MIELIARATLEQLEKTEECLAIRKRIIDDKFEANAKDYIIACEKFNETAQEYFQLGFKTALKMTYEINSHT